MFSVSILPVVVSIGAAVDYSCHVEASSSLQVAVDAAALATLPMAASATAAQIQTVAQSTFEANFQTAGASGVAVTTNYDNATKVLTVSASGGFSTSFMNIVGISQTYLSATTNSKMSGGTLLPVCVMVTDPDSGHTLLVKNESSIEFQNCLVQVNTLNWDAVEARDTSYIHSTNGQNCFVGDIHYGDVSPPKSPTCTFFPDPFATLNAPETSCDYTNKVVNSAGTILLPGTYCNGLVINASTTFLPGLYIIRDGKLQVVGDRTNVQADDVTFVLTGSNAGLFLNTDGTFNVTPNRTVAAGSFAGFAFYLDTMDTPAKKKKSKTGNSTISKVKMTASGIFYFQGQSLNINNNAEVTINPGSIVAEFILPDQGTLNLTGM